VDGGDSTNDRSTSLLYKAVGTDYYIQASSYIYISMALSIKDPEADRLAREVAKATGETLTMAVVQALRERLARVRRPRGPRLSEELLKIGRRCAHLPVQDMRSAEEIVGYDEHGLPR
jgi:antitoxin VapB